MPDHLNQSVSFEQYQKVLSIAQSRVTENERLVHMLQQERLRNAELERLLVECRELLSYYKVLTVH